MRRPAPWLALLAVAVLVTVPVGAQGRPINVTGRQALAFGAILAGVPSAVLPTDGTRAGQYEIRGRKDAEVQIVLTLPAALGMATGEQIPLTFGPTDAASGQTQDATSSTIFDPRAPLTVRLSGNGRLYVFLGGTLSPTAGQRAGSYAATIILTVAYTGN